MWEEGKGSGDREARTTQAGGGDDARRCVRGARRHPHLCSTSWSGRRSGVQGSGLIVQGSGFRVQGSGFRVQGAGFRVQGSGFKVQG